MEVHECEKQYIISVSSDASNYMAIFYNRNLRGAYMEPLSIGMSRKRTCSLKMEKNIRIIARS